MEAVEAVITVVTVSIPLPCLTLPLNPTHPRNRLLPTVRIRMLSVSIQLCVSHHLVHVLTTIIDGGYNNYLALWYSQWIGAAGAGAQPPGDAPQPPSGAQ